MTPAVRDPGMRKWLLPDHIDDVLPEEAAAIETVRRAVLELFRVHGYELVQPPLLEYLDSLLTGTGRDLDLKTFKLVDQMSGRLLGLRADITPQVARIDAHLLNRSGVTRLCYAGPVLHTLPDGPGGRREQLQIGAEVYGHAGIESDIEIVELMGRALGIAGVEEVTLSVGHVGVFGSLCRLARVPAGQEAELLAALQSKDVPALGELIAGLDAPLERSLRMLPELYGGAAVLAQARRAMPRDPELDAALDQLEALARHFEGRSPRLSFDLSDLRGYHYHSGMVFAAFAPGWAGALALGGRYDQVGRAFGRARPATGFSMDLRELADVRRGSARRPGILAPAGEDPRLAEQIERLRAAGEAVVRELPGHDWDPGEVNCDRRLVLRGGVWNVEAIASAG